MNNNRESIKMLINKKLIFRAALPVLVFSLLVSLSSTCVSAKDYSLAFADESIYIYANGTVHVNENIEYHFSGCWHEAYKEIPLHGMVVDNIKVSCAGAYCKPEIRSGSDKVSISGFLYPDESSSDNEVCDRVVKFTIDYDLSKVIKVYNDSSEFHYLLWGDVWDKELSSLHAKIYLPKGDGNISYWFHSKASSNAVYDPSERFLDVETSTIPAYDYFDVRLVMPGDWFSLNPDSVWLISGEGVPEIRGIEQDYENKKMMFSILSIIVPLILILIAVLVPFLIYYTYGREPRIDYSRIYERELPYNDPPAVVNALMMGKIGKPTMDAFTSTIMDLARRGYLSISTGKINVKELLVFTQVKENVVIEFTNKSKGVVDVSKYTDEHSGDDKKIDFFGFNLLNFINFNFLKDDNITKIKIDKSIGKKINELNDFEYYSLVFLAGFSVKRDGRDVVLWLDVEKELKSESVAKWFLKFYTDWNDLVEKHITMNEIFIPKGDTYLKIYGVFAIIVTFFTLMFMMAAFNDATTFMGISFILMFASAVISLVLPEEIGGRWTPYGRTYYEKWKAFEHFLTDFSQMKRYPPESVVLWEHYIVYATALGIADKVIANMKLVLPAEEVERLGIYSHPAAITSFNHAFTSGITKATAGQGGGGSGSGFGGGVGGVGGGFEGGGGGAR